NIQQIKFLEECLAAQDKALAEARKLKDMPYGRFPVIYSPDFIFTAIQSEVDAQHVRELLYWHAVQHVHTKDPDGAMESCRALLNTVRTLGDGAIPDNESHALRGPSQAGGSA